MQIHRVIFMVIVLLLAGCSQQQEIDQLAESNRQLQTQLTKALRANEDAKKDIEQDYAKRKAVFDQAIHQAGVSSGCRSLINVCPVSITAPGDAAIAAGYGGGGTVTFWAIYLTKWLFVMVVFGCGLALWTRQLRPDLTAQRLAGVELTHARKMLKESELLASKANQQHQKIEEAIQASQQVMAQLEVEISKQKEALAATDTSIKGKKAAIAALDSFKF